MKKLLNKKGFTIVELVIVIAVIAILAAVLIPTFSNVVDSAKETATLQEAKGTLDSYIGVMSSDGASLPEGTVFIVYENEAAAEANKNSNAKEKVSGAYVYYKGALHKFDYMTAEKSKTTEVLPTGLDLTKFILPKINGEPIVADTYISWTEKQINDFTATKSFYFAYNQVTPVGFNGGSTKCKIYSGSTLSIVSDITVNCDDVHLTPTTDGYTAAIELQKNGEAIIAKDITLEITTTPTGANYTIQSQDSSIATVDATDQTKIKILKTGTVTLSVYAGTVVKTITLTVTTN